MSVESAAVGEWRAAGTSSIRSTIHDFLSSTRLRRRTTNARGLELANSTSSSCRHRSCLVVSARTRSFCSNVTTSSCSSRSMMPPFGSTSDTKSAYIRTTCVRITSFDGTSPCRQTLRTQHAQTVH